MSACIKYCRNLSFRTSPDVNELWLQIIFFGFNLDSVCLFSFILFSESWYAFYRATRRKKIISQVLLVSLCHYFCHIAHVNKIAKLVLIHELDDLDLDDSCWWVTILVNIRITNFKVLCLLFGPKVNSSLYMLLSWALYLLLCLDLETD